MSQKIKGFFALLASAIIYASFSIWVRILGQQLTPYQQIGFRNFFAFAIAILAIKIFHQSFKTISKAPIKWLSAYTITFPISVVFYTFSVLQTKIITTIFGLYIGSLLTSLVVGRFVFKEKLDVNKLMSLVCVFLGLVAYAYPFSGNFFSIGLILALLSGIFDGLANSFRKFLAGTVDRFVLVALQMIGGLAVAASLVVFFGQTSLPVPSMTTLAVGGLFGMLLVAISYLTLVGFSNFDLNLGTVVLSSELFFATVFGLLVFSEQPTPGELTGGLLIFLATCLANFESLNNSNTREKFKKWLFSLKK